MKYLFSLLLFLISFISFCQVPTTNYQSRSQPIKNYINNCNYGQTSYQIDRSTQRYLISQGGINYNAYYYYIWFYNESLKNCQRTSTYISSINVYIDNQYIGNYYILITGDYYFLTFWSVNPKANIRLEYSKPIPY